MARSLEIEALNLEIGFPVREEFCSHRYGLLSEPELSLKSFGDAVTLRSNSQKDMRSKEKYSIVSSILAGLVDGISSSKIAVQDEPPNIPLKQVALYDDNHETQSCNNMEFQDVNMEIGSKLSQRISTYDFGNDHLVPENERPCEDNQESIDDLWNEMSSGQTTDINFHCRNSAKLTASLPPNEDRSSHLQNEIDEPCFSLSNPSSQEEFDGSNDMFSQVYQKSFQSKKKTMIDFRRTKPQPGKRITTQSGPSSESLAGPCKRQAFSYSQNERYNDLQNIFETEVEMTPMVHQDQGELEINLEGFTSSGRGQLVRFLRDEPDLFENVPCLEDEAGPLVKLDENIGQPEARNFATQSNKSGVSLIQEDAIDDLTQSLTEISDLYDEEIDAAIKNYINTPKEGRELGCASSYESTDHLQALDSGKLMEEKVDVGTQTTISGSIYSSVRYNRVEESPVLKRSLQALQLEYTLSKKSKTIFALSPVHSLNEQMAEEPNEFEETPEYLVNREVFQNVKLLKKPSEGKSEFICENNKTFWIEEKQNQNVSSDDKLEQDNIENETEHDDQEVPRNIVMIGALPIQAPANFCWENHPQSSVENYDDVETEDVDTPTKSKAPRRLRLGLSRLSKPRVSLHRFL